MITKFQAIKALRPNSELTQYGEVFTSPDPLPSEEEIQNKLAELEAAEPLRLLRIQRNNLLSQTDWRMTTDYPYADQSAWATYRTELRDLPSTAEPTLDEQGNLTNVVWPTPPSDL